MEKTFHHRFGWWNENKMEREKIGRKRRGIAVLTLAALFFWYLPQIQVSRQIRKEQEEAVEMYVREEKEENKEENEKSEEVQEQEPGSTDKNLFRTIDFAGLRSKNREICAWLWIPGCALDVPVAHGQDNAYYLTHDAFCRERIYGSIFAPCDTPEDFSERHTILYGHNMRDGTMFGGLKKYREASWKQEFPYLYLYLPGEAWQCRIWSECSEDFFRSIPSVHKGAYSEISTANSIAAGEDFWICSSMIVYHDLSVHVEGHSAFEEPCGRFGTEPAGDDEEVCGQYALYTVNSAPDD